MTIVLKPLELLYRGVNRVRRTLYRARILKGKRLPRPVISIGNIAAGGTGKTPAVIAVARFLQSRGLRVAVLTRGYGRADASATGLVDDIKYGDEPLLIKRAANCDAIVGKNRHGEAVEYLRTNHADVFILDDGFQHLQLKRDFDVVIDAPSRFHREGRAALADADVVIPRRLRTILPDELRGRRVFAFAGLADNAQFFASLAGLEVSGTKGFPDHHRYTAADLDALRRAAAGATLVTTEKDAVKIDAPDVIAIRAEFDIDPDVLEQIAAAATSPDRKKKRRKNALLQRIEYRVYRAISRAMMSRSEESLRRWGTRLGALASKVLRGRDRLGMRNLRAAFPQRGERELRQILDASWRHFGREALLYLQIQNLPREAIVARCTFVNEHVLAEARARGKGTLMMSGHFGSWEIGGLALTSLVPHMLAVARPLDNELLEADLQLLRERTGTELIDRRRAARALLKGLSANAVVAMLPDQAVQPREGILVPFLGRPAWTTPAPAKMALRAGSTIVFAFCIPDGLRHRLEFEEPIRADLLTEDERDPVVLTQRINDVLSRRISSRPDLWLWMHDRWKGTGEGR